MGFQDSHGGPGDGTLAYEVYDLHGIRIPLPDGWALENAEIEQRIMEPLRMELRLINVGDTHGFGHVSSADCGVGLTLHRDSIGELCWSDGS